VKYNSAEILVSEERFEILNRTPANDFEFLNCGGERSF
jgi:hypothetical protein